MSLLRRDEHRGEALGAVSAWFRGLYGFVWFCCSGGVWTHVNTRWWFEIFFIFSPTWGDDPI